MAFNGELLRFGNYVFPLKYIEAETYDAKIITQDVDSGALASGKLNRNVVPHRPIKIQFETLDGLTNKEIGAIMKGLRANYKGNASIKDIEKKLPCTAYIPELDDYITQDVYLKPDTEFPIDHIEPDKKLIEYLPINFIFTGY